MQIEYRSTASPQAIWDVWTDLDRFALAADITAIERLDAGTGFGVGTTWRETRRLFGREATEEMTVTAIDPGHSYTVEAQSHGSHYTSVLRVTPADPTGGSVLSMTFEARGTNPVTAVLAATIGRLTAGSVKKALRNDLIAVARAAEADEAQG